MMRRGGGGGGGWAVAVVEAEAEAECVAEPVVGSADLNRGR
jgi:hypothetical protein